MKNKQDLFSIGEIAKALGITRRIILHYEERGLVRPDSKNGAAGNRYYTIDTFTQIRSIRSLQNMGLTLDEIREYFNDSADLMPLIRRMERLRDELNLNIEKLYERSAAASAQIKMVRLPPQRVYRRVCRGGGVADKTVYLRNTALEAMRVYGTDTTRRMYFTEYALAAPEEISYCVAVPQESQGEHVETLPAKRRRRLVLPPLPITAVTPDSTPSCRKNAIGALPLSMLPVYGMETLLSREDNACRGGEACGILYEKPWTKRDRRKSGG